MEKVGQSLSRGSFRGVSEVSGNHSGFPSTMGAPLSSYNVSQGIHSVLNSNFMAVVSTLS